MASDLDALAAAFKPFADRERVPGMVAAVVRRDGLPVFWTCGLADVEEERSVTSWTRFRIASMTKSLTALAALALRDARALSLDDPVVWYVPEFAGLLPVTADSPAITVRDLMHHLAGWVKDDPWADRLLDMPEAAFIALVREGWPAARAPGVAHEYSNLGYALLGRVIAHAAGMSYQRFVQQLLLDPLGMKDAGFAPRARGEETDALGYRELDGAWVEVARAGDGAFAAIGGLVTGAEDYARYIAHLLRAWPPRDDPDDGPIRRATLRESAIGHGPTRPMALAHGTVIPSVYGAGMIVSEVPGIGQVLHHAGGLPGFGCHVALAPHAGVAVFSMTNRTYAQSMSENIALLRSLCAGEERRSALPPALAAAAEAARTAYDAADLAPLIALAAHNLLADRGADERRRELEALRVECGPCRAHRVEPAHELAGRLILECERGRVVGEIALAPAREVAIQRVDFARV